MNHDYRGYRGFRVNRFTSGGKPFCYECKKPGHVKRCCPDRGDPARDDEDICLTFKNIKVTRCHQMAIIPEQTSFSNASWNIHACEKNSLLPGRMQAVKCGFFLSFPPYIYAEINNRKSGPPKGFSVIPSIVDSRKSEIFVYIFNFTKNRISINVGDEIAKLIFRTTIRVSLTETEPDFSRDANKMGKEGILSNLLEVGAVNIFEERQGDKSDEEKRQEQRDIFERMCKEFQLINNLNEENLDKE